MTMRFLSKLFLLTVAFGVLCAAVATARTNITATLHSNNPGTSAACPWTENFTGTIRGAPGTPVTYRFDRNNGNGQTQSTTIPPGGSKQVSDSWTSSISGDKWEILRVITPQEVSSNRATFQVRCR
jgi:hypothetical protein